MADYNSLRRGRRTEVPSRVIEYAAEIEANTSHSKTNSFIDIELMITRAQGQDYKSLKLSFLSILQDVRQRKLACYFVGNHSS
ncbi:hypothetical protein ACDT16_13920 [Staphylococcus aureus]